MTTLVGLDLAGRQVVVAGAGAVGTRRARGLAAEGAHVVLVDPRRRMPRASWRPRPPGGRVELVERPVAETDVDDAWLVVAATANPGVDAAVSRWCEERRTWCIRGATGTARTVAATRHDDLVVGVASDRRRLTLAVRRRARRPGPPPLLRRRSTSGAAVGTAGGWCSWAAARGTRGLVTLAGLEALAAADVVVTDRLGATALLDAAARRRRGRGRRQGPTHHAVPQAEINRILVDRARRGLTVVRLKGGDPFVYGRGGEEVHACRASGVEVHVVPGITSALAVPGLAGIPSPRGAWRPPCTSPPGTPVQTRADRGDRGRGHGRPPHGGGQAAGHLPSGPSTPGVPRPPGGGRRARVDALAANHLGHRSPRHGRRGRRGRGCVRRRWSSSVGSPLRGSSTTP